MCDEGLVVKQEEGGGTWGGENVFKDDGRASSRIKYKSKRDGCFC